MDFSELGESTACREMREECLGRAFIVKEFQCVNWGLSSTMLNKEDAVDRCRWRKLIKDV